MIFVALAGSVMFGLLIGMIFFFVLFILSLVKNWPEKTSIALGIAMLSCPLLLIVIGFWMSLFGAYMSVTS